MVAAAIPVVRHRDRLGYVPVLALTTLQQHRAETQRLPQRLQDLQNLGITGDPGMGTNLVLFDPFPRCEFVPVRSDGVRGTGS